MEFTFLWLTAGTDSLDGGEERRRKEEKNRSNNSVSEEKIVHMAKRVCVCW